MNEQELPTFTYIVPGTPVSLPFVIVLREPLPVHAVRTVISFAMGAFWESSWAVFLHTTTIGRWLRLYRTWLTVVIGVGGCLAIVGARHSWRSAATALTIFAGAGAPIVTASILEEFRRDID